MAIRFGLISLYENLCSLIWLRPARRNFHWASMVRPYVIVQFEQNEFVSRDPTDEADKEVKCVPISRIGSGSVLGALANVLGNPHPLSPSSSVRSRSSSNSSNTGTTGGLFVHSNAKQHLHTHGTFPPS